MIKRVFDIVVSSLLLIATSPVFAVCFLVIRADGGPALYRSRRIGKEGLPFEILKFRTMVMDADHIGPSSTADDDPRITHVGYILRRYKLDELPQLLNVLANEMSLVGPRPQVAEDVARYTADERRLLSVRPGLTDYASIRFRNEGQILCIAADPDEAYRRLIRPEKIRLGLAYVDHHSIAVDVKILSLTLLAMLNQRVAMRYLNVG